VRVNPLTVQAMAMPQYVGFEAPQFIQGGW
jgi:hypothetical protein